jgi:hypothetical protein
VSFPDRAHKTFATLAVDGSDNATGTLTASTRTGRLR